MKDISVFQVTQKDIPDRIITVVATQKDNTTVWNGMMISQNGKFVREAEYTSKEVLTLLDQKIWTVVSYI